MGSSLHIVERPSELAKQSVEAWHSLTNEQTLEKLRSSAAGLSTAEASQHLAADGPNAIQERKGINGLKIFAAQFKSLIIWILIAAGVLSGALGDMVDAVAIFPVVVRNATIGFYQEFNAEKSIEALRKLTAPQAKVRRGGQLALIPALEVVAGDILALEPGT
jgi:P-type Ca2+ transporter type 2C